MTRYHPALVALHWIMAIMIIVALIFGRFALAPLDNADPQKLEGLTAHMTIGVTVGLLLILRLVVRVKSEKPPHAQTGNALLDMVGVATHWLLYTLVAGMVLSGLGTAIVNGLFPIVFGGSGDAIPANMIETAPRLAHGTISMLLMALVALHIAAAIYHLFILRDSLFRRMWFGNRRG